ncbi:hypothetical protein HY003_01185 [Candidatus Saccharibacteria bacterium]|nr:hypothetical protein [Candidatus Saccharibacteria bacterium]MBI3337891.1 hypothetical protein [Candidatus Saccharibacteria bacterium]
MTLNFITKLLQEGEQALISLYKKHKLVFIILFSSVAVASQWQLLANFGRTTTGDFDYFAQAYEAIRQTIVNYHQFPWMNAWVGGGVPLYANPQIGVFSIQTILVVLFGTLAGLKLSLLFYSLAGFWAMFYLLKIVFKTNLLICLALSTIWITNGFFTAHAIGHYTFALFQLFPLLLLLMVKIKQRRYWLYFGLVLSVIALSSFHYAAIQSMFILGFVAFYQIVSNSQQSKAYMWLYLKAGAVFFVLSIHRIYYTFDYAMDFPRTFKDPVNRLGVILKTFVIPTDQNKWFYDVFQNPVKPNEVAPYSWGEYNAFVGYFFVITFIASMIALLYLIKKAKLNTKQKTTLVLLGLVPITVILVALGDFFPLSPYSIIHILPGISGMRIPSRWLIWAIFSAIVFVGAIHKYLPKPSFQPIIVILIVLGGIETFAVSFSPLNRFTIGVNDFRNSTSTFQQFENYDHFNPPKNPAHYNPRLSLDRKYESYDYEATLNNYGEAKGYEPLADTRFEPTLRCGILQGCELIKSRNAKILKWSPNEIVLKRSDDKPIELNMNLSNYWTINGNREFAYLKTVDVLHPFIIQNKSQIITLKARPRTIIEVGIRSLKTVKNKAMN